MTPVAALPIRTEERESYSPWKSRKGQINRRFSPQEDARLTELRLDGQSLSEIAVALGRRKSSVQVRLAMLAEREEEQFGLLPAETFCPSCNGYHVPHSPTCKAPQPREIER